MKSKLGWILIAFFLVAAFTALVLLLGEVYGLLSGIAFITLSIVGLFVFYRSRANRLLKSLLPGETLVARGIVSESTYDETPAILVCGDGNRYRVQIADKRGSQVVQSVASDLASHENALDLKRYLTLYTSQSMVPFAPVKRLDVASQPDYAWEVLQTLINTGIPAKGKIGP